MKKVIVLISIMVSMMSCNEIKIVNNNITSNINDDFDGQISEDGSYKGFDDLPESMTIEEAVVLGLDYIQRQSQPYANQHIWDDFYESSHKGEACNVRMISFYEEDMEHPYYKDIYYKDGLYTMYDSSVEDAIGHQFKYLLTLEGNTGKPLIHMRQVVLADKADLTLEAYERAMVSSSSTAFDNIGQVRMLMFEVVSETTLINLSYEEVEIASSYADNNIESSTYEIETNYTPLEDIYSSKVKTIQCDYAFEYGTNPIVAVHPDGFLVGSFISLNTSVLSPLKTPIIMLIDETGEIIWKEIYDYSYAIGNMSNLVVYDDGRFLFTLSNWPDSSMGSPLNVPSKLIQCNSKGKVNWIKEFKDTIGSVLKFVFLTRYNDILIAGEILENSSRSFAEEKNDSDIVFLKLDDEGEEVARLQYGGISNEYLKNCDYIPDMGIVFTGWSNSSDSEFAREGNVSHGQDYVAFVNLDLEIDWINHVETYERFSYDQMKFNGAGIFLVGKSLINPDQEDVLENKQLFIVMYDVSGEEVYKTYCPEHQSFQGIMSVDRYSEVVVGSGYSNKGVLSFYNKYGEKSHNSMNVSYEPSKLSPTDNGGFVVKSIRKIASTPQPLFISSIWFDQDVLIEKYDNYKQLMWRKVFNDYDDLRVDFVEVLTTK